MEIHLIDSAGKDFYFPVNPEEVKISRGKGYETVNIMALGEFDFISGEKVKEITFSSFFPLEYDAGYCQYKQIPNPKDAMNQLTATMNSQTPVRLLIVGPTGNVINALVMIATHDSIFRGGEPGDIYYDLTARTWRKPRIHVRAGADSSTKKGGTTATSRPDTKNTAKTYTVKSGDSLSKIAKLELGDCSKWSKIYNLNKTTIGPNSNLIKPGQKLVLPS
ncbi:LysM peptidoglycan-binding domain-containing protein [Paenibacillus anaericanus]|uniref:LysM peptidoglycan-binding domain-containing protein n=1 Tax=Paenibacillus anaericanus TaxID=170367 RepID=A0A3S1BSL8_9BACL|nr:LysM peptidoglycan-binding domain-containing protein [Paenibacillus anaericanus]RUT46437.1 LysM peptidoglycan-binding domain-containing protein [Paenibacillus anaericanus]